MKQAVALTDRLTDHERAELAAYEHLVTQPKLARGLALRVIRDRRLYRETHETFDQYCLERWKLSKTHANRLIRAADVLKNVAPIGVTDLRESHARALASLPPDEQRLVAGFVRATAPIGRITAPHVKSLVTVVHDVMRAGAIDDGSGVMVPWHELPTERKRALFEANLTEETYERHQRHREHVIRALSSSASAEWFTPQHCVEAAREVLGAIDLDPASCAQANKTVQAARYFDVQVDGLKHDWQGNVFVNPPYGPAACRFVERLLDQFRRGNTTAAILVLSDHAVSTLWFAPLWDFLMCFAGRVHFDSPEGPTTSAPHGTLFVYLGPNEPRFFEVFRRLGPVMRRVDR